MALGKKTAPVKAASVPRTDRTKFKKAIVVGIDDHHDRFEFYALEGGDRGMAALETVSFRTQMFSPEFYTELTTAARGYAATRSDVANSAVVVVLPDSAVLMDSISIPNLGRRRNAESIDATLTGLFKNRDALQINCIPATQNKQSVTYAITALPKALLNALCAAMNDAGMPVATVTFAANAAIDAVCHLSIKNRTGTYMLFDIQHHHSRVVFVAKGRTTGCYDLPFGYSILRTGKVASEDLLFDHSTAELAVLNARERARAKQLTVQGDTEESLDAPEEGEEYETAPAEVEDLDAQFGEDEDATADPTAHAPTPTIKVLPKKVARKLPKFMLRPQPHTDEEYGYENFRIFQKWALTLLQGNPRLSAQGAPEAVFVNMPAEHGYILDMVNAEREENGIEFLPLDIHGDREGIVEHLELYGGMHTVLYNKNHNF